MTDTLPDQCRRVNAQNSCLLHPRAVDHNRPIMALRKCPGLMIPQALVRPLARPHNKSALFLLSVIALVTTGVGFSIRGNIAGELQADLFDPVDKLKSAEMVATALGIVFLGFAGNDRHRQSVA